jgi:hypothetical protein
MGPHVVLRPAVHMGQKAHGFPEGPRILGLRLSLRCRCGRRSERLTSTVSADVAFHTSVPTAEGARSAARRVAAMPDAPRVATAALGMVTVGAFLDWVPPSGLDGGALASDVAAASGGSPGSIALAAVVLLPVLATLAALALVVRRQRLAGIVTLVGALPAGMLAGGAVFAYGAALPTLLVLSVATVAVVAGARCLTQPVPVPAHR